MKFKQLVGKAVMTTKKNSPAILIGAGIIGLTATAVLAYRAKPKVEAIIEDIEEARANETEVDNVQVGKDLVGALYGPIVLGAMSAGAIIWGYKIQNNRIAVLASALAAQQAKNIYFETKYKKEHGEEAFEKFRTPTHTETREETDDKGKVKKKDHIVADEVDKTIGEWYKNSSEYARDDHSYNMAYIASVTERLELLLFQRGHLMLNEVREAFGFERIRNGALLGWSAGDIFHINETVTVFLDEESGEMKEQIWLDWSTPRYIYDEVSFTGRYSPFGKE